MGISDVLQLAGQFGIAGLLAGYIFWSELNNRRDRREQADREAQERKDRLEVDKEETASRVQLASALSALTTVITGGGRRV